MKLAHKLALAFLLGVLAVVLVFSVWRIRREVTLLDADARRDHRVIGLTAAAAVGKTQSLVDAIDLVHRVDASRENMSIRFVVLRSDAAVQLRPLIDSQRTQAATSKWVDFVRQLDLGAGSAEYLVTYVRTPVVGEPDGAIQLAESLASRAAFVRQSVVSIMLSGLVMALVCGLIAGSIGTSMVGRPVTELMSAARRIGAGDFDVFPTVTRRDEFGELAKALQVMGVKLAEAQRRTEEAADARVRALEQLRHADRLATLGQLASVLAHEIGTPLNVIAGHAKIIASGLTAGGAIVVGAQAISSQCHRMTQIVRRILDYARRKAARRVSFDAHDAIGLAADMLAALATERHVQVRRPERFGPVRISADPDQIQQALTNVLLNAIQASPDGAAVQIELGYEPPGIDEAPSSNQSVVIGIRDQGAGIGEALHAKVFEPFFTTKPSGDGTGLGLSIARDIVEEHGGRLTIASSSESGTVFELTIPAEQALK